MYGASDFERKTVLAGKLAHYMLLYGLPALLHGPSAMFGGAVGYLFTQVCFTGRYGKDASLGFDDAVQGHTAMCRLRPKSLQWMLLSGLGTAKMTCNVTSR